MTNVSPPHGDYALVIPARYQSSRFPGKPLALIAGKPMIERVWIQSKAAVGAERVYIATDDSRVADAASAFGAQIVMTSPHCLTGTDRLAEANQQLNKDFLINVQGDEPLVAPEDIKAVIETYLEHPGTVINAMCPILDKDEYYSRSVPKVVVSESNQLLYMSRAPIVHNKTGIFESAFKQVCIYAFAREHLRFFYDKGAKSCNEYHEDIEILRFLDHDKTVKMVQVSQSSIAVDFPEDIQKVEQALSRQA